MDEQQKMAELEKEIKRRMLENMTKPQDETARQAYQRIIETPQEQVSVRMSPEGGTIVETPKGEMQGSLTYPMDYLREKEKAAVDTGVIKDERNLVQRLYDRLSGNKNMPRR